MNKKSETSKVRNAKALLLPMRREEVDTIVLPFRIALQAVRSQKGRRDDAFKMAHALLFTSMLTEDGHGQLDHPFLEDTERQLASVLTEGQTSDRWIFSTSLCDALTSVIN